MSDITITAVLENTSLCEALNVVHSCLENEHAERLIVDQLDDDVVMVTISCWDSSRGTILEQLAGVAGDYLVKYRVLDIGLESGPSPEPQEPEEIIEGLDMGVRAYNALKRAGIQTIPDLLSKSERQLKGIPNFGDIALEDIKLSLAVRGLDLRES